MQQIINNVLAKFTPFYARFGSKFAELLKFNIDFKCFTYVGRVLELGNEGALHRKKCFVETTKI